MSTTECTQTNECSNPVNHTVIEVVEEKSSALRQPTPSPYSVGNFQSAHSTSFDVENSNVLESNVSSSRLSFLSRFRLSPRSTSKVQWFTFLALHIIVFAWLLAIHLHKTFGSNDIDQGFPIIAGLLLGAWTLYMMLVVVRSPSFQPTPLLLDPLLDGAGEINYSSDAANESSASARNQASSRLHWGRRLARILFLTACIGGEGFLCFIIILDRFMGEFAAGTDIIHRIPASLLFLIMALNPFSWFMSYKFA